MSTTVILCQKTKPPTAHALIYEKYGSDVSFFKDIRRLLYSPGPHGMRETWLLSMANPKTNMVKSRHLPKYNLPCLEHVMRLHRASNIFLVM